MISHAFIFIALLLAAAQTASPPEATSLFGKPLISAPPTGETKTRLEADLANAQAEYDRDPSNAEATIWLGRRLAYLGRFRDAIDVYSRGIQRHPNEPRLYRHRGHRYITSRKLDLAIADLRKASQLVAGKPDEIEPDGAPNKAAVPRSTLQ
jgi:tetratricopeptide (TPR) repeat protein